MIAVAVAAATRYLLLSPSNVTMSPAAKAPVPVSMAIRISPSAFAPFTRYPAAGDAARFLTCADSWMLNPSSRPTIPSRRSASVPDSFTLNRTDCLPRRFAIAEEPRTICRSVVGEPLSERTWRALAASDKSPAIPKGAVPAVPTAREDAKYSAARSASISLASARKACLN